MKNGMLLVDVTIISQATKIIGSTDCMAHLILCCQ